MYMRGDMGLCGFGKTKHHSFKEIIMTSSKRNRDVEDIRARYGVNSVQIASFESADGPVENLCAGGATTEKTIFQQASLSKTVGTALCLEYFRRKDISSDTTVNSLLATTGSSFRLKLADNVDPAMTWADEVTIVDLMNHQGLGQHYVNGIPLTEPKYSIEDLCRGNEKFGYPGVYVHKKPKTKFNYSGGGFLVLQLLLEAMENKPIEQIFRPMLDQIDMRDFSFGETARSADFACGYRDDGTPIPNGRLEFPGFAAGGLGPAESLANFWQHLLRAGEPDSFFAAETLDVMVRHPVDKGAMDFMGAFIGTGTFIARAKFNSIAIHQAANDGFRGVYVICVDGPDRGRGFIVFSNGDNNATLLNARVCQIMLHGWDGINPERFARDFDWSSVPQAEIVNMVYKSLVFDAFEPEEIASEPQNNT
eukprot:GEMP01018747.1.p1 GENE.GEMP01018747.1~~GEMP01018747.1.p1  ORF type:complete len:422 (+),score=71.12 GEMP01018747.1:98-1363(+)